MKLALISVTALALLGCGVETATTAATAAKAQAEQAKEAQQAMDKIKVDIDAAAKQSAERLQRAEGAN